MELTASKDIAAPRAQVFTALSDFAALEAALNRSIPDLERDDGAGPVAVGSTWRGTARFHGITAKAVIRLTDLNPPAGYAFGAEAEGVAAVARLQLTELAPALTRLDVRCELTPKGLRGRVVIQSLKLVRGTIEARLEERLDRFAGHQERKAKKARRATRAGQGTDGDV